MTTLSSHLRSIWRFARYILGAAVLIVVGLIVVGGFTSFGARFIIDKVASSFSNRDLTVTVEDPGPLLTGHLEAARITVSDTKGTVADIRDVSIQWSPWELFQKTFHADDLRIGALELYRLPVKTLPDRPEQDTSGSALPIDLDIDKITLPSILLGQDLTGVSAFNLAASGQLQADESGVSGTVSVVRPDMPGAHFNAEIVYAPERNQLHLQADLNEPANGMLANLLRLPGKPAMEISLTGKGPLSNWDGTLEASLDGQPRVSLQGNHRLNEDATHTVALKGNGDFGSLVPPMVRPLFAGQSSLDLVASFDRQGKIDIQTGNLATGNLVIASSGTFDPNGNNSLNVHLLGPSGPVDVRWPLAQGEARFSVSSIDLALTGDAKAAKLDINAAVEQAEIPQATIGKVNLTAQSNAFNLTERAGTVQVRLNAGETAFTNPQLQRAIQAPVIIKGPFQVSPDAIGFNGVSFESAKANGTINGSFSFDSQALTGNIKLTVDPAALPETIASRFTSPITAQAQVTGTLPSKVTISDLVVNSDTLETTGTVSFSDNQLDADLSGRVLDAGKLLTNAQGQADYKLTAKGPITGLDVDAHLQAESLKLAGRVVENLDLQVSGIADPQAPQGTVSIKGSIDQQPIAVDAELESQNNRIRIPSLDATVGPNRIKGSLDLSSTFEPSGQIDFDLPDLSLLSALAGQNIEGDLKGSASITSDNGKIAAKVKAAGSGVTRGDTLSITQPDIDLTITDLKNLAADGMIRAKELTSGNNTVSDLSLDFDRQQNRTSFDVSGQYDNNPLSASGSVNNAEGKTDVQLDSLSIQPRNIPIELSDASQISIENGVATVNGVAIRAGSGTINIKGSAGETLNLDVTISDVPASLLNDFVPNFSPGGTISGTVNVTGTPASPIATFDLDWRDVATSQTRGAGLAGLNLSASGNFRDNRLTLDTRLTGNNGLSVTGGGSVSLANGRPLDLQFNGQVPLAIFASQLASQGFVATGNANAQLRVTGTVAGPQINGSLTANGASLTDVRRNLALNNIRAAIQFTGQEAVISQLSGNFASGGSASATGRIGINPAGGFPADLNIALNDAVYVDGTLVVATVDGNLALRGPLLASPVLSGNLRLDRVAITVPERFPTSLRQIKVKHIDPPPDVREFLREIAPKQTTSKKSSGLALDIQLDAPSRIFVRGRGIDAELGGSVVIRGTTSAPQVSGNFTMRRGRMTILNRRLNFSDKGRISFTGNLTPTLDMSATSASGSTTLSVNVTGAANDPDITFSSTPDLPQDEVLAQLIFGQSLSKLSPVQIAQLADAVSQLAGGRSTSLFEGLRNQLGVDDFNISTDEKGRTTVSIGRYLNERTYFELQQGTQGPKAVINLDVGRGVKLRAGAGAGGGEAGIVYEREY